VLNGAAPVSDYPSQRSAPHLYPQLLLDTCVIQNLAWARARAPKLDVDQQGWSSVSDRYGPCMALELRAVEGIRAGAETICSDPEIVFPYFVASKTAWHEFHDTPGPRQALLLEEWRTWRARAIIFDAQDCAVPDPLHAASPQALNWAPASPDTQLRSMLDRAAGSSTARHERLGPFRHHGDVRLIREAMEHEIGGILTTDLRSFWTHRGWLYDRGVEIWRPSDVATAMINELHHYEGQCGTWPRWPPREACFNAASR
jgi:hypothetical protein